MQFKTFDIVPHGTKFDFVGKRKIALILSTLFNLSVILWSLPQIHGLDYGVDFAGGTEMQVKFDRTVDPGEVRKHIEALGFKDAVVQTYGPESEHSYLIRVGRVALLTPEDAARIVAAVKAKFPVVGKPGLQPRGRRQDRLRVPGAPRRRPSCGPWWSRPGSRSARSGRRRGSPPARGRWPSSPRASRTGSRRSSPRKFADAKPQVLRVEYVGPAVGRELRNQGFKAILYAIALIVVYVGLRFDFRFSPGVVVAILHDAIITLGYFAFTGREFNLTSVAVILTVVGYSVNDTVVVYDRIRENQGKLKGRKLADIVNISINETLGRTILTSFATALSLVGLLIFGVGTIFDFAMAMLIGIISGTYSTWFIAAPMTIWLEERAEAAKAKKAGPRRVSK